MPYIGKHLSIVDACELLFALLDEELDISSVEIPEPESKTENVKRISRREKVRISRRLMQNFAPFPVVNFRISPLLSGGAFTCWN